MTMTIFSGIRRWSWILVLGAILGGGAGWATSNVMSLSASVSSATILVTGELSEGQVDSALTSNEYINQRMSTYVGLATSRVVTAEAARQAGTDPGEFDGAILASNPTDTTLIDLGVQAPTPDEAQVRATALVGALTDRIARIENPAGLPPRVALSTVSSPTRPDELSALSMIMMIAIGALAGAALGGTVVATMIMRSRQLAERRAMYDAAYGVATNGTTSRDVLGARPNAGWSDARARPPVGRPTAQPAPGPSGSVD